MEEFEISDPRNIDFDYFLIFPKQIDFVYFKHKIPIVGYKSGPDQKCV